MVKENVILFLNEKFCLLEMDCQKMIGVMKEIIDELGLLIGYVIEVFDYFYIQGVDLVLVMVVFVNGELVKKLYCKYKLIIVVDYVDEVVLMCEVIFWCYFWFLKEEKLMLDMIMMDGGLI